jgi:solute carrier family 25 phosphate transporter 3
MLAALLLSHAACRGTPPPISRRVVVASIPALVASPWLARPSAASASVPAVPAVPVPMQLLAAVGKDALPETLLPGWERLQSVDIGARTFEAVERQYPVNFVAYLARCLVNWEPVTRRWWVQRQAEAAAFAAAEEVPSSTPFGSMERAREEQYRASAYRSLIASVLLGLEQFLGPKGSEQLLSQLRSRYAVAPAQPDRLRALAQLFSLLAPETQPTDAISAILGEADAGRVTAINLEREIGGLGAAGIAVTIERPPGKSGKVAAARAVTRPTGRWRAVRLMDGGEGYRPGEKVDIIVPIPAGGVNFTLPPGSYELPRLSAKISNGVISEIKLVSPGRGYLPFANGQSGALEIVLSPPMANLTGSERPARAELLPEYALSAIEVTDGGQGYIATEPPEVSLRRLPPPPSAEDDDDGGWAAAAILGGVILSAKVEGRRPAALPPPELAQLQARLSSRQASGTGGLSLDRGMTVELLPPSLTPVRASSRDAFSLPLKLQPDAFGTPAAAPVERQTPLSAGDAARIFLSGGLCGSAAHTALVPLDVIKTRLQSDPEKYSGPVDCIRTLSREEGLSAFTQGLAATTVGYAVAGSLSFGLVEVFGRAVRGAAGPGNALLFSVPLLGVATVMATAFVACAVCPFEAVRVVAVRTGGSSPDALRSVLARGGPGALFEALPANVLKEVPFVVAKFITFDRASAALLAAFPEVADASLSGSLSLVAGAVAGLAAVVASHPADVVFTKSNTEGGTLASAITEVRESPELLLQGLGPRLFFGALLVALQFYLYTQLRGILGVSKADLTLVWDALTVLKT